MIHPLGVLFVKCSRATQQWLYSTDDWIGDRDSTIVYSKGEFWLVAKDRN